MIVLLFFFFFFFQAEDGIRDIGVTGVQTCALPISSTQAPRRTGEVVVPLAVTFSTLAIVSTPPRWLPGGSGTFLNSWPVRSEERRVGKECRSRWWPYH